MRRDANATRARRERRRGSEAAKSRCFRSSGRLCSLQHSSGGPDSRHGELQFEMEGPWKRDDYRQVSLAFIDPSLGGTGYLRKIADEFVLAAARAIEHLDHPNCQVACYRCLKSYHNQWHHPFLRWPAALPHLQELAAARSQSRPLETGDLDDPKPWLEAYAAGCRLSAGAEVLAAVHTA
jgi:hypothetical protein